MEVFSNSADSNNKTDSSDMKDIPIRSDPRSFEEQHSDSLKRSEKHFKPSSSVWKDSDDWCDELSRKMEERRQKWDEEIQRKREDFFQLKPTDQRFNSFTKKEQRSSNSENFSFRQMPTAYERGSDGKLHFRVRFDVENFSPNDLKVSIEDSKLIITARHEKRSGNTTSTREFSRSVDLPVDAEDSRLTCSLSKDGILLLDAPLRAKSSTLHHSEASLGHSSNSSKRFSSTGGLSSSAGSLLDSTYPIVTNTDGERWLHLEIDLGREYQSDEIKIKTINQKIYISARHEEQTPSKTSFKEYTKEYDIPVEVDPYSVTAKLDNGLLIVEAPVKPRLKY